jgi:DNA-binding NarL/FixJ family response regulator
VLARTVRRIAAGEVVVAANLPAQSRRSRDAGHPVGDLDPTGTRRSRRERDVVQMLGSGLSTAEVARRLAISPQTVRTHLSRARSKLQGYDTARLGQRPVSPAR